MHATKALLLLLYADAANTSGTNYNICCNICENSSVLIYNAYVTEQLYDVSSNKHDIKFLHAVLTQTLPNEFTTVPILAALYPSVQPSVQDTRLSLSLTMAANTPRQSRLASSVRSLLTRACCCTCIGLSLCLTRPFFSARWSFESGSSPIAAVRLGTALPQGAQLTRSSCFSVAASSDTPSPPICTPARRGGTIRRHWLQPTRCVHSPPTSPASGVKGWAARGNARLLPSACTADLEVSP